MVLYDDLATLWCFNLFKSEMQDVICLENYIHMYGPDVPQIMKNVALVD
jgi:hypothetical protein